VAAWAAVMMLVSWPAFAGGLTKPVSKNAEAQKLIDQAWQLDRSDSNSATYKKCMDLMEQANKLDPKNTDILTELSRYYWSYGDTLPKKTEEQQGQLEDLYDKGMAYAEQSLEIKETVGAHYWYAVNKASSLEFSNIVSQAAAFPSIYSHSQYVTTNEPDYYYGAPGRLWSEVLVRVPKTVVEMVGWDVQEAVDNINTAIKLEPRYLSNYVYKARFYYKYFENKEEALKLLDHVLKQDAATLFPEEVTDNKAAQKDAKKLWKEITGKEYPQK
jgi:tetratricopeptide (TPR) repeat protein